MTYFQRNKDRISVNLETLILGYKKGHVIDHIDNDPLNCTRRNLRFATYRQNNYNRSSHRISDIKYRGVYYANRSKNAYYARLGVNHKTIYSKSTTNIHIAAMYYNILVLEYTEGFGMNAVNPAILDTHNY